MSDASDTLRRAAKVLREHAEVATRGPWIIFKTPGHTDGNDQAWTVGRPYCDKDTAECDDDCGDEVFRTGSEECEEDSIREADASYIAIANPAVGLALADWLDSIAETHEGDPSDYCDGKGHEAPWPFTVDAQFEDCTSWWCENVDRALTTARAVLRETET